MKFSALALFVLALSGNAFAGVNYRCIENGKLSNPYIVELTQIGDEKIIEGTPVAYNLRAMRGPGNGSEVLIVKYNVDGIVLTEDVVVEFKSEDESIEFTVYLDEASDASMRIAGEKNSRGFTCDLGY